MKIINLQYKDLTMSKKWSGNAVLDLFCKIVKGDKSDNIPALFKNCGPKTAIKYLSPLAGKNGGSFDVAYQLGVAFDKMKNHENAITNFKKAINIEPKYPKAFKRLGYAYNAAGKHEEAVECFKKAMELEEI